MDARAKTKSKMAILSKSRADNSRYANPIKLIIELVRDIIIINILSKFYLDWPIFVDARV